MEYPEIKGQLINFYEESCVELFKDLDCGLEKLAELAFDISDTPLSQIDAGSDDIELVLSIHLPSTALSMTYPVQSYITDISEEELEDWLCEISNRLLGKLKAKCYSRGCSLNTGLPQYAENIYDLSPPNEAADIFDLYFSVDGEEFLARIGIEVINPEFMFSDPVDDQSSVSDGDIEFF